MKKILLTLGTITLTTSAFIGVVGCSKTEQTKNKRMGSLRDSLTRSGRYSQDKEIVNYKIENSIYGHGAYKILWFQYKDGTVSNTKFDSDGWFGIGGVDKSAAKYYSWSFKQQQERNFSPDIKFILSNGQLDINYQNVDSRISELGAKIGSDSYLSEPKFSKTIKHFANPDELIDTIYDDKIMSFLMSGNNKIKKIFNPAPVGKDLRTEIITKTKKYPLLSIDFKVDYSNMTIKNMYSLNEKQLLLSLVAPIAKNYGKIVHNLRPSKGAIMKFIVTDWKNKKTTFLIAYDNTKDIVKIAPELSDETFFTNDELTKYQWIF